MLTQQHTEFRRTKIIATLGPATDNEEMICTMIEQGMNVARINFSHGKPEEQIARAEMVRNCAIKQKKYVGILADLQGPKIRIGRFENNEIVLNQGDEFILDAGLDGQAGDQNQVGISYKELPRDVKAGNLLFLGDGDISLRVVKVQGSKIYTTVEMAGSLSNNKGINLQGGGLSAPALTDKDHRDIKTAGEMKADFLALSFVRTGVDIQVGRELFKAAGGSGKMIAKIERTEAIENIDEIIKATDAVMLARGDLGIEIGDHELPGVQKRIIKQARTNNRVAIVATQMMQSMVDSPIPTRAEVLDVANAVIDGTDAVMLSAETAIGKHPDKVISAMKRICRGAERHRLSEKTSQHFGVEGTFERVDEAIAMASMFVANRFNIVAIIALTESGDTAKWLSRVLGDIPIYAVSRHISTHRRVTLFGGVFPVNLDIGTFEERQADQEVVDELVRREIIHNGERIIITKGDKVGVSGSTNVMKVIQV